jgi:general stress protein YciG
MPRTAWALKGGTRRCFHANPEKVSELARRGGEAMGSGGASPVADRTR